MKEENKNCEVCKTLMPRARGNRKYCSPKCGSKAYYIKNGERYINHAKKYREDHKEHCKKQAHERYLKQKDKIIARTRKWEEENPEKAKEYKRKATNKFRTEKRERFNELVRKAMKKYQKTPKGKEAQRKASKKYYDKCREEILEKRKQEKELNDIESPTEKEMNP